MEPPETLNGDLLLPAARQGQHSARETTRSGDQGIDSATMSCPKQRTPQHDHRNSGASRDARKYLFIKPRHEVDHRQKDGTATAPGFRVENTPCSVTPQLVSARLGTGVTVSRVHVRPVSGSCSRSQRTASDDIPKVSQHRIQRWPRAPAMSSNGQVLLFVF
jgi:hypothetical protein